jgi:hypothetical protein
LILEIPYFSQLNQGIPNLCGQSSACSLVHALTDHRPGSAKQVALDTNTADGTYTSAGELVSIGKHYGLTLNYTYGANLDWYQKRLNEGIIPIALVNYGVLNPGHSFNGSHWLCVIGFDNLYFYVLDPLRLDHPIPVPIAQFHDAITSLTQLNNPNTFAVYPLETLPMSTLSGVNIEPRGFASPAPDTLRGFGYVRFPIIIQEYAGETIDQAMSLYAPLIQAYQAAGIQTMLPLTHQIGLEGKNFNFENMSAADWQRFTEMYLDRVKAIATRLKGLVVTFQILNEQDSQDSRASIIVPPVHYGTIFNAVYTAIKAIDPSAKVITGGYNSGADRGKQQFVAANIIKTDGVAFHPYGASANGMYQGNGIATLQTQISKWQTLNLPLYISEWGALGFASEPVEKMAQFVSAFTTYCNGRVKATIYFSWFPQDVHPWNSYPVINPDGSVHQPVFDALTGAVATPPDPAGLQVYITGEPAIRARSAPSTDSAIVGLVTNGVAINRILELRYNGGHPWQRVNGVLEGVTQDFWFAVVGKTWKVDIK